MGTTNAIWTSSGDPVGQPITITTTGNTSDYAVWTLETTTGNIGDYWNTAPMVSNPTVSPPFIPSVEEKGKRVVKAPSPSLELILIEIAKVLKEGGDILEVREIFERYKMKLVDYDGEVIFDPKDAENLEDKGL